MKTVAFVNVLAIILLIYSLGAFVPQTQDITNTETVSGLTVLSDTELAQQVGGDWEGCAKKIKKAQPLVECKCCAKLLEMCEKR